MKNKITAVLTVIVLLTAASSFAMWERKDKMPGKCGMEKGEGHGQEEIGHWEMMADELDLSDKQKEQLKEQKYQSQRERIKNQSELKLKMLDLKHELMQDGIDDAKVDGLIDEISQIQKQVLKNRIDSMRSFRKLLDKDQFSKFKEMRIKHMKMKNKENYKPEHKKGKKRKK